MARIAQFGLSQLSPDQQAALVNPARDSAVNPKAAEPQETYATRSRRVSEYSTVNR